METRNHPPARPPRRLQRCLALAGLGSSLVLVGCFEEPVAERIHLSFPPGGTYVVTASAVVRAPSYRAPNPPLDRRITEARADYAAGWASWNPRFAELDPARERIEVQRVGGEVSQIVREAVAREPRGLMRFFSFSDVSCQLDITPEWTELRFVPGRASRASLAERRLVERALSDWSTVLARYLATAGQLFHYLEANPHRAEPCLGGLLDVSDRDKDWEYSPAEQTLLDAAGEAMGDAIEVLQIERGRAFSLDELSRKVFDPFPAPTSVALSTQPDEVDGFDQGPDGTFVVPVLSMWEAMSRMEGVWLAPDPLVALVRHLLCETCEGDFPLHAFLALPRTASPSPPQPRDISAALAQQLTPRPLYRLRWREPVPPARSARNALPPS